MNLRTGQPDIISVVLEILVPVKCNSAEKLPAFAEKQKKKAKKKLIDRAPQPHICLCFPQLSL